MIGVIRETIELNTGDSREDGRRNEKDAQGDHHSFYGFVRGEIQSGSRRMFRQ